MYDLILHMGYIYSNRQLLERELGHKNVLLSSYQQKCSGMEFN